MSNTTQKDIVIDTNVMRLYDSPKDDVFKKFFHWIRSKGILTMSRKLLLEYGGSGNQKIFVLINELQRKGRYNLIGNKTLKTFTRDRHFKYTCNYKDKHHAKLVFLSHRKRLIAFDDRLIGDVNSFPKINGVKPCACKKPDKCCY